MSAAKKDRNQRMAWLRALGVTYRKLGEWYSISTGRARQVTFYYGPLSDYMQQYLEIRRFHDEGRTAAQIGHFLSVDPTDIARDIERDAAWKTVNES